MITVEFKTGCGYLGAGIASKKIQQRLLEEGVKAHYYAAAGYVRIDIKRILVRKIEEEVKEKLLDHFLLDSVY